MNGVGVMTAEEQEQWCRAAWSKLIDAEIREKRPLLHLLGKRFKLEGDQFVEDPNGPYEIEIIRREP